jgi:hypothetical protein
MYMYKLYEISELNMRENEKQEEVRRGYDGHLCRRATPGELNSASDFVQLYCCVDLSID